MFTFASTRSQRHKHTQRYCMYTNRNMAEEEILSRDDSVVYLAKYCVSDEKDDGEVERYKLSQWKTIQAAVNPSPHSLSNENRKPLINPYWTKIFTRLSIVVILWYLNAPQEDSKPELEIRRGRFGARTSSCSLTKEFVLERKMCYGPVDLLCLSVKQHKVYDLSVHLYPCTCMSKD